MWGCWIAITGVSVLAFPRTVAVIPFFVIFILTIPFVFILKKSKGSSRALVFFAFLISITIVGEFLYLVSMLAG